MASLADLARRLNLALVGLTDDRRGGDPLRLARHLPQGAWLIFRHYDHPERSVLAIKLSQVCRENRLTLFVAKDFHLAQRLRAGLHLPDRSTARPLARIRLWHRRGGRLSIAAHDRAGLIRAARLDADAALLSPVFATASHPEAHPLGILAFRRLVRQARLPIIALGGINRTNVRALGDAKIFGVAAIGAFTNGAR